MKNFTFLMIFSLLAMTLNAQQAVFNWEESELSPGNNLKDMAIEGANALIAGYGNTLVKSADGGVNWSALDVFAPKFNLPGISVKGNIGYIVAQREKLYDASPDVYANGFILKTMDGGETWAIIDGVVLGSDDDPALSPSATLCHGLDFQAVETVNDSVAFCSLRWYEYGKDGNTNHAGIFKTIDGGLNWMNVSGDMGSNITSSIDFNGDVGFAGGNKHLFKATAGADSLVDIFAAMPGDGSDYIFDMDFVDENEVLITTTADSVYFSSDGGTTFDKFSGIKGGMDILRINDSTIVVGGGSNKSYVSTDNGQNWALLGIATSIWEVAGVVNDSINMLAKSAIYKCAVSDLVSGNYNFVKQDLGDGNLQKAFISGANITIVGNDNNFYKSVDAGISWIKMELPEIPALQSFYEEVDFEGISMVGDEGYACFNRIKFVDYPASSEFADIYWSGGIAYTDDNWESTKMLDIGKVGKENEDDTSINPNHDNCNGVNTSYIKFLGDDVVLLWTRWYDYSVDPKAEHSRVFKTNDGGKNWIAITHDLGKNYLQDIDVNGDTMYIAGSKLLLKSTNANLKSASTVIEFTNLYPVLDEGEDDAMFIKTIWADGDDLFLVTSVDSCFMSSDGGNTFKTMANIKGSGDFYRFDKNSYMILGGTGKSKFTNDGATWEDCHPGTTIYSIGGEYNGKIYALAKGAVYSTSVEDLDLKTSIQELKLDNELNVLYKPASIELISTEKEIERCAVYSITGKLISLDEPNNRNHQLYNSEYQTGMYIVNVFVEGNRISRKVIFK